jgi:hypothetical protein
MSARVVEFMSAISAAWDGLVFATIAAPTLPSIDSVRKATLLIAALVGLIFSAGVGAASWVGLPSTVREHSDRLELIDRRLEVLQIETCTIREAVMAGNPAACYVGRYP